MSTYKAVMRPGLEYACCFLPTPMTLAGGRSPMFPLVVHQPASPSICCLPTPMILASGGESDVPACGLPAIFSVHLASSAVTPAGSVHKSRGDNVVRMSV